MYEGNMYEGNIYDGIIYEESEYDKYLFIMWFDKDWIRYYNYTRASST